MRNDALNVYTGEEITGTLARSDLEPDTTLFSYRASCAPSSAVSLTVPVVRNSYDAMSGLLPIFDMNLPEGALREALRKAFSKTISAFDDLSLLSIVGHSQIGRLRFMPPGQTPDQVPDVDFNELLNTRGTKALFDDLLRRYASSSGVSGAQPKILVGAATGGSGLDRITRKGATHIVKAFDNKTYPELAANEFFCMRAAQLAGLPTPKMSLSDDRQILVVERFDINHEGRYLGFEDFCVLRAVRSHGKYDASYESLAQSVRTFVSPGHLVTAMEQLFLNVALSCVVRNGDAHLKNFGVLYSDCTKEVSFAPPYDITSTVVYLPRDVLALSLAGTKAFPDSLQIVTFGRQSCGLTQRRVDELLGQVGEGVGAALKEMNEFAKERKDFRVVADSLTQVFQAGLKATLPSAKSVAVVSASRRARP
ncbi:MAG: type II toxin-antitoxin system HipA family toxin [Rhodocyclaceae bacterium]|nr:type II toxin-antitoxin system HipA family toxin [Rhodocyclaceae bacterium]